MTKKSKIKTNQTQVQSKLEKTNNLIGLVEVLLNVDKKTLNPLNATSLSDNNGGRILY